MRESLDAKRRRARKIIRALKKAYPDAKIALDFSNPLELLVATILAAQCTDERVNRVTPALFAKYRTARDWAQADLDRKSTRLNSSHTVISYAVFCLKKKNTKEQTNKERK